jgi:hypothetical protein
MAAATRRAVAAHPPRGEPTSGGLARFNLMNRWRSRAFFADTWTRPFRVQFKDGSFFGFLCFDHLKQVFSSVIEMVARTSFDHSSTTATNR